MVYCINEDLFVQAPRRQCAEVTDIIEQKDGMVVVQVRVRQCGKGETAMLP